VGRQQLGQLPVKATLERLATRAPGPLGLGNPSEVGPRRVGEHDVELADVIDRHSIADGPAAGGVVAEHPADGGAVAGRGVRPEHQAVRRCRPIQLVLDDSGLYSRHPRLGIDVNDAVHVPGQVEHQSRSDRLAGETRAATSRHQRHAVLPGKRHRRCDVVGVTREDHAQRHDRVHARVPREQVPRVRVELHLAVELAL
jgi:hypothetical protein